jgi:hypothetical protein
MEEYEHRLFCDRCGAEIKAPKYFPCGCWRGPFRSARFWLKEPSYAAHENWSIDKYDLCRECHGAVKRFITERGEA